LLTCELSLGIAGIRALLLKLVTDLRRLDGSGHSVSWLLSPELVLFVFGEGCSLYLDALSVICVDVGAFGSHRFLRGLVDFGDLTQGLNELVRFLGRSR